MISFLICVLAIFILLSIRSRASACTAMYVGKKASADGSVMIARSHDLTTVVPTRFEVVPRMENAPGRAIVGKKGFRCDLPETTFRYVSVPACASAGFGTESAATANEFGLTVTTSVTAYTNENVGKNDPSVHEGGIGYEHMALVPAACCRTAREAVKLLAEIIDRAGTYDSNIIMLADRDEAWYMETYSGHQYCAVKMPEDCAATYGNQLMLDTVDPDSDDVVCSPRLFSMPAEKGFAVYGEDGKMNLFDTYAGKSTMLDSCNLRTWRGQMLFAKKPETRFETTLKYPLFYKVGHKISVNEVMDFFCDRYDGTEYSAEVNHNNYRVIAVERQANTHVIQVFPDAPADRAAVMWTALGGAEFAPYMPLSNAMTRVSGDYFRDQTDKGYDGNMPYYVFKKLNALCGQDRARYGAGVKSYWQAWEKEKAEAFREALKTAGEDAEPLTAFCVNAMDEALTKAREICDDLIYYMMLNTNSALYTFDEISQKMIRHDDTPFAVKEER